MHQPLSLPRTTASKMNEEQPGVTPRVNQQTIGKYVNGTVCLVGKVVNCTGSQATIQASDGQEIMVHMTTGNHYGSQFVEIIGRVNEDMSLQEYRSKDYGDEFDLESYNGLVELWNGKYSSLFM